MEREIKPLAGGGMRRGSLDMNHILPFSRTTSVEFACISPFSVSANKTKTLHLQHTHTPPYPSSPHKNGIVPTEREDSC